MPETLLDNFATRITESEGQIRIREKQAVGLLLGLGGLLLGGGLYWLGRAPLDQLLDPAEAAGSSDFLLWGAYVLLAISLVLLVVSAIRVLRKPVIFDTLRNEVSVKSRRISFSEIAGIEINEVTILDRTQYSLVLDLVSDKGGKSLPLAPLQPETALEELRAVRSRLQSDLSGSSPVAPAGERPLRRDERTGRRFVATLLITGGAILAGAGALLMPDVVISSGSDPSYGFLLWPLGLWIAALGIAESMGMPAFSWLSGPPTWRRLLTGAVWIGSYLLVTYTRLG